MCTIQRTFTFFIGSVYVHILFGGLSRSATQIMSNFGNE
jgi:hypothetical protein